MLGHPENLQLAVSRGQLVEYTRRVVQPPLSAKNSPPRALFHENREGCRAQLSPGKDPGILSRNRSPETGIFVGLQN